MPAVAVVILNWNGQKLLEQYLPSVTEHSGAAEIIVADNASTDQSIAFLKEKYPSLKVIQNKQNFGFAGGYNEALKSVESKYFILLNSDVEVTENWIDPLISVMESDASIGAVQPKILSWQEKEKFEYAGAAGGFIDRWGYPFCRGRIFNELENDNHQYDETTEVFWATGACMVIRSDVFNKVNGFDEDFFAHMEEIDLCWRIKNAGYKIYCQPASKVYHLGGGTLNKYSPRKTYLNFRNNLMMMIKNLPQKKIKRTLLIRFILDGLAAIKFLFARNGLGHFKSVFDAHMYIYNNFKKLRNKRKNTFKTDSLPTALYNKSIVFDHFISHKNKFSELDKSDFT